MVDMGPFVVQWDICHIWQHLSLSGAVRKLKTGGLGPCRSKIAPLKVVRNTTPTASMTRMRRA